MALPENLDEMVGVDTTADAAQPYVVRLYSRDGTHEVTIARFAFASGAAVHAANVKSLLSTWKDRT